MPQVTQTKLYNTFIAGIVTEASGINYPEDASLDELNLRMTKNGSRVRRKGLQKESTWADNGEIPFTTTGNAVNTFEWNAVNGDPNINYLVVQDGMRVWIYENGDDLQSTFKSFTSFPGTGSFDLSDVRFYPSGDWYSAILAKEYYMDFSAVNGSLYITHRYLSPLKCTVSADESDITITPLYLKERDFKGVDDNLEVDERPAVLSDTHSYNLDNQGWEDHAADVTAVSAARGFYPSNAESWIFGKRVNVTTGVNEFNYNQFAQAEVGRSLAPRGHKIVDVFQDVIVDNDDPVSISSWSGVFGTVTINTGAAHGFVPGDVILVNEIIFHANWTVTPKSGWTSLAFDIVQAGIIKGEFTVATTPTTTSFTIPYQIIPNYPYKAGWLYNGQYTVTFKSFITQNVLLGNVFQQPTWLWFDSQARPRLTAGFAGRVWYSGIDYKEYVNRVYFSQIVQRGDEGSLCYQAGDPTSEFNNSIVDTDGGYIEIAEADYIIRMVPYASGLLVFARNGVWFISGGELGYFTATSYSVDQVINLGCYSQRSIVSADGSIYYWSESGIIRLSFDSSSRRVVAEDVSTRKINDIYQSVPDYVHPNVTGAFNHKTHQIHWLYHDGNRDAHNTILFNSGQAFDWALIYDTTFDAFTRYQFPVVGLGLGSIWDVVQGRTSDTDEEALKFLVSADADYWAFMEMRNPTFEDYLGEDYEGEVTPFIEVAYETLGDPSRKKQAKWMTAFFNRTEENWIVGAGGGLELDKPSSCLATYKWDWSDSNAAGKQTTPREIYRHKRLYIPAGAEPFDNGYPLVVTKNKVRGQGRSLHIRFAGAVGKDMQILGWSIDHTGKVTL